MSRKRFWMNILILGSAIIPFAVLVWWIKDTVQRRPNIFGASSIGGRLSYIEAKAIDFLCSAVLAPLIMVLLDYLWFENARTSVVNRQQNGYPLASLLEASNTSSGGFNPIKFSTLMQGKTWRFFLLSLLVLLSGIGGKMLSNFIAYEAFSYPDAQQETLERMNVNSSNFDFSFGLSKDEGSGSGFSASLQSNIANQVTGLLTGLSFEDAVGKLGNGSVYIGTNATGKSLNAIDTSVISLTNVPGYRLSIDCQPLQPDDFYTTQMGELSYYITPSFTSPDHYNTMYHAEIPGIMGIANPIAHNELYQYVAFSLDHTRAYLGVFTSFNDSQITFPSPFGEVKPKAFNMTSSGFSGTKIIMTTWGIDCTIMRQDGLLNYTRQGAKGWTITKTSFSGEKTVSLSFLYNWQTALNYQSPGSSIPGIGPPLARTAGTIDSGPPLNWSVFALNYLYASGEVQRMSYEVASSIYANTSADHYNVSATAEVGSYRITYIPFILLMGLISVAAAAIIVYTLVLYTRNAPSTKAVYHLDVLRLMVDSVSGLNENIPVITDTGEVGEKELKAWAQKVQVIYSEVDEGNHLIMRLRPTAPIQKGEDKASL
ncbi:hypothetical protein EV356DRAFT_526368 [Viridothelium virens]|uniref:Uncharacterized protein n=1 Tax=Viridothelium virens TaxID=1048519 RepID=A0A6A6H021_VIRVR|nr:hypothetical protein EV356DRAFT_526368 [Viridothelium virens]